MSEYASKVVEERKEEKIPKRDGLCQSCKEPCIASEEILDAIRMGEEVEEPEIEEGRVTWCPFYQQKERYYG